MKIGNKVIFPIFEENFLRQMDGKKNFNYQIVTRTMVLENLSFLFKELIKNIRI